MEENWNNLIYKIDEFMYGELGIVTTIYSDSNLKTYNWDIDKIVDILQDIKNIKDIQGRLTKEQIETLEKYDQSLLLLSNDNNNIKQMRAIIIHLYKNLNI